MIIMIIFNMSMSYFYKISFHYFEDYIMTKLTLGQGSDKHQNVLPRTVVEDANYPPKGQCLMSGQCQNNIKRFASLFLSFSDDV
jgi:hypothetical protein